MIRVGVAGYGYWGPNLARNLNASGRFELVAVADRSQAARQLAARSHRGLTLLEDAMDLTRLAELDAVVVATPVDSHYPIAREALARGKHVLVEKPLCRKVGEGEELIALAAKAGRVLMVDHTFLFTGSLQIIDRTVRAGQLGKICYFDSMRVNLGLFQPDVNCLWDLAPHDLSVINHLMKDDIIAIDVSGYCHVNPTLPDMVYLTLHYVNDVVAHFNLSWMSPVKVRRFAIGGTSRMLIWDDLDQDQKIRIYNSGIEFHTEDERRAVIPDYRIGDILSPRVPRHEALLGVVNHFADVIERKAASIMDGEAGLKVVRTLSQAQAALDRNLQELRKLREAPT